MPCCGLLKLRRIFYFAARALAAFCGGKVQALCRQTKTKLRSATKMLYISPPTF
jgi:hypothetical protein